MVNSAIEIISSKFGIYYAALDPAMNLSFPDRNILDYLKIKKSEEYQFLTDFFPELYGFEDDILDVLHNNKEVFSLNTINRTADNEIFFNIHVFNDPDKEGSGIVIVEDITRGSLSLRMVQQRRNEMILRNNELIRREEFTTTLLNTIPDPVFYKDSAGKYIGCNREFENFTGVPKDEIAGKGSEFLLSNNYENTYDRHDEELIINGGSIKYEADIVKASGDIFHVIINKCVFFESEHSGAVIVGVLTDITVRKKMEVQLREIMNMLEISRGELKDKINIMEKNLLVARNAVDAFLQKDFPAFGSLDVDCRYLPLEQIGGDFYSVIPNENGVNIFVCDISGHGVAAALFLSVIKYFSESILPEYWSQPGRYLEELNSLYWNRITSSYFFTAIAGSLSFNDEMKFTFANGGHPHPILMKSNGEILMLGGNDTLVGVFEDAKFKEFETIIEKGDMLFLYTDGISETFNSSEVMIGYDETLLEFFADTRKETLEETLDAIIEKIVEYRGEIKQEDDILLLGFHSV